MNRKFIAACAGSAGFGALLSWAITADLAERRGRLLADDLLKMQDALREKTKENIDLRYEINDKLEEIENLQSAIDVETGFAEEDSESDSENSPGETSAEINSGGMIEELHVERDISEEEVRARLQEQIAEFVPMSEEATEAFIQDTQPVTVKTTKYDPPMVISEDEYNSDDEGSDYAKITLTYFPKQQVLLDEDQEPIDDVESYVGWRALNRFGDGTRNADVVYVRNRRMSTDFEVERETEADLPLHVQYGMPVMEFESNRAAGKIKLREEDE